jgi:hypothetical protein
MNSVWGKAFVLTGLIFMLGEAPSWGGPPNNDVSDAAGNTAGEDTLLPLGCPEGSVGIRHQG